MFNSKASFLCVSLQNTLDCADILHRCCKSPTGCTDGQCSCFVQLAVCYDLHLSLPQSPATPCTLTFVHTLVTVTCHTLHTHLRPHPCHGYLPHLAHSPSPTPLSTYYSISLCLHPTLILAYLSPSPSPLTNPSPTPPHSPLTHPHPLPSPTPHSHLSPAPH